MSKKFVAKDWRLRIDPDDRFEITKKGKEYLRKVKEKEAKRKEKVIKK